MGTRTIRRLGLLAVAVGFSVLVLTPLAASAQTDYPTTTTTPTTDPCTTGVGPSGQVVVCGTSVTNPPGVTVKAASGSLAFTGGNIALIVGLGLVAMVGGVILVRLGRRASATS